LEVSGANRTAIVATQADDPVNHRVEVRSTIHLTEAIPRQPSREAFESLEESKSSNPLVRRTQLEEERLAGLQRPKYSTPMGLPEIDFVDTRMG
jgi:hypothetical protein